MKYFWKGLVNGDFKSGAIEANTLDDAIFMLKKNGHIVISIEGEKAEPVLEQQAKPVKPSKLDVKVEELLLFTRKLSAMISAGLSVVPALTMLAGQTESASMRVIIKSIVLDVNSGKPLSIALEKFPKVFDNIYISLIKAGEASGKLDIFLNKIGINIQKKIKIIRTLKGALRYPAILLSVAFFVVLVMMIYVVPIFAGIFENGGIELPLPTKIIMMISNFFRSIESFILLLVLIILTLFFKKKIATDRSFKFYFDKKTLTFPIFGSMITNSIMARFSEILANLLSGGVTLIEALDIAKNSVPNIFISEKLDEVKRSIFSGESFALSLRNSKIFPETFCGFIDVGEETGKLNDMLMTLSDFYEDEFDNSVTNFSQLLEPIMIVFLGLVIGFILIAMYLPIFKMGNVAGA